MEVTTTEFKHCELLKASGRIDSATAPKLAEAFKLVHDRGRYKIVLDLDNVDYISSSGLWVLVNAQKASKRYNRGEVVLACVPERIYSALDLAGFIPFFKLYDNVTSAVGSF
jgi:anti-sigma B factor antagonist